MPDMIGILATVLLVSTVCTLVFAILAYAVARRRRLLVGRGADEELEAIQREELEAHPRPTHPPVAVAVAATGAVIAATAEDPFVVESSSTQAFKTYSPDQAEGGEEPDVAKGELDLKWR